MRDTKERILLTALQLFAQDGYEAVSVSRIAGELGMTKSALYKHYPNKRGIFDSILARMEQQDFDQAQAHQVPEGPATEMAEAYRQTPLENLIRFTLAQFRYWTEEPFSSAFRRMLTLEQYRNPEMATLYQQYLAAGPVDYLTDLFQGITGQSAGARQLALEFYGPVFLLYSVYDGAPDKEPVTALLQDHLDRFARRLNPAL